MKEPPKPITNPQRAVLSYLIQKGATQKGRWVDGILKKLSVRALESLVERGLIETKDVAIPRSEWPKNRRKGVRSMSTVLFRLNAAKLLPIKGVQPRISKEIIQGFLAGKSKTDWRPFHPGTEWMGAARCGVRPRKRSCLKVATHVSYTCDLLNGFQGRFSLCANCLPKEVEA